MLLFTGQGRTYYMYCNAINNNIKALPKDTAGFNTGDQFGDLNRLMSKASAMQAGLQDSKDPTKSLGWYRTTLGTDLSTDQLFQGLDSFYNELDRYGIPHQ